MRLIPQQVVKKTHETGGFGSIGYGCVFKKEEAMKNLLRTHTTAISAQMLYKLANQEGGFKPKKYFSIDRVFRNEAMDATHLCEFHQVTACKRFYHHFFAHSKIMKKVKSADGVREFQILTTKRKLEDGRRIEKMRLQKCFVVLVMPQ